MLKAVYIDGPNLNGMQTRLGIAVDFKKLKQELTGEGEDLGKIVYFAPGPATEGAKRFLTFLSAIGYEVHESENGQDVDDLIINEIAADIATYDAITLVSGDGDLYEILDLARKSGKKIEIVANNDVSFSPDLLALDCLTDLSQIKDRILDPKKTDDRQMSEASRQEMMEQRFVEIGKVSVLGITIVLEHSADHELTLRFQFPH